MKKEKLSFRPLFFAFFGLLITLSFSGCLPKKEGGETPVLTPAADKKQEPASLPAKPLETSIMERPFMTLLPSNDGHWVTLEIKNLRPEVNAVDYELIYFAGDAGNEIERGVAGTVELKGEKSLSRKILFGSESCTTGTCRYKFDENVSQGRLDLKLKTPAGIEKYTSAFRLQKGSEAKSEVKEGLTTGDGNFKFVAGNLASNAYFLTISTVGVPQEFTGTIAALPYGIFPSVAAKGMASFKSTEEAKILSWNGQKWEELKSSFADGSVSAPVQKTGVFVLVK